MPLSRIVTNSITDDAVTNAKMGAVGADNMPTGSVIQVQSTTTNTPVSDTSSASALDLMSVNITPNFSNSKILITLSAMFGNWNPNGGLRLLRDSTNLAVAANTYGGGAGFISFDDYIASGSQYSLSELGFHYLDTPSTTSQITYKLKGTSNDSMYFNITSSGSHGYASSSITAMEIKG